MKSYPKYVVMHGSKVQINTDYRVALRCYDVIRDDSISDVERNLAVVYLLYGFIPEEAEDVNYLVDKAVKFLLVGEEVEEIENRPYDMDFDQDAGYIYASFMSDYGINIDEMEIHWWRYIDLLQGLTENCALSRVRELRNYDLSEVKDQKTKNKIMKAKEAVALKKKRTKEEQEAIDKFEKLFEEVR